MTNTLRLLIPTAVAALVAVTGTAAQATTLTPGHSVTQSTHQKPVRFKNCKALNKKWKHGVGKHGAHDRVSKGKKPVKNFRRDNLNYLRNARLDRDNDGIACEKH